MFSDFACSRARAQNLTTPTPCLGLVCIPVWDVIIYVWAFFGPEIADTTFNMLFTSNLVLQLGVHPDGATSPSSLIYQCFPQ